MRNAKTIQVAPETYKRIKRVANKRRWSLGVTTDEAAKALEEKFASEFTSEQSSKDLVTHPT